MRYSQILGGLRLASMKELPADRLVSLKAAFSKMMKALYRQEGASFKVELMRDDDVRSFIDEHSSVLDSSFEKARMSDAMRRRLQQSDYVFSGIKTFHELKEAFPSLLDEKGERKPFERFLNDVQKIDRTYNRNYLRTEYNFVSASSEMAGRWEDFEKDGDEYWLQYRTAGDDRVRPEHAALNGVTLPPSDPFWDIYYPPNGWNCRCTVVQVSRQGRTQTTHDEAMSRGAQAMKGDKRHMFSWNPGKEGKTVPDYNPYTISRCRTCDIAKGKMNLSKPLDCDLCKACQMVRARAKDSVIHAAERIATYKEDQWEHTHISERADGFVVTERSRIAEAEVNKQEYAKYQKELSMCKDIADNGHDVEFLHGVGRPKGQTFDIRIDGIPADLKFIEEGGGGIPKHTKHAFHEQGAKIVVFRLPSHVKSINDRLTEAYRKYGSEGKIYFYYADDTRLREIKK